MTVLVVCVSKEHGNTRAMANAIASEVGAEVVGVEEVTPDLVASHDVIGFGSGIRFGRHYQELLELVDRLPEQNGKGAFIFSTSGFGFEFWHRVLRKKLLRRGFTVRGETCCKGLDTMGLLRLIGGVNKGRPDARDLAEARRFAKRFV